MEKTGGVMNCQDMDLLANDSIDDSAGALDYFSNGGVIDLWNNTPGLGQCWKAFNGGDSSLRDELGIIVGRVLRDELPDGLDIIDCSMSPDQGVT